MSSLEFCVWKDEPLSPSGTSAGEVDDKWLYFQDKFSLVNNASEIDEIYDQNTTRAQVATKLLEELDEWIKEGNICIYLKNWNIPKNSIYFYNSKYSILSKIFHFLSYFVIYLWLKMNAIIQWFEPLRECPQ